MTAEVIATVVDSLLENDNPDFGHSNSFDHDDSSNVDRVEERQGTLCAELAKHLEPQESQTVNAAAPQTVRSVLGDNIQGVAPILGRLMRDRVDQDALLPATQDVAANDEVLEAKTSAMTLTLPAMQASLLYSQLIGMPGALGGGLVDLEWLTAVAAVARRWALECCGRERLLFPEEEGTLETSTVVRASPTKSPPKKRTRRQPTSIVLEDDDTHANEYDDSPQTVLQLGLEVALALCKVPRQREFASWSPEAREVILEVAVVAFGTAAALKNSQHAYLHPLCELIVSKTSESLQQCLTHIQAGTSLQHETLVVVLRGFLHLMQLKEVVPGGEKGKLLAHSASAQVVRNLMDTLSTAPPRKGTRTSRISLGDATNHKTPSRRRRRSSSGLLSSPSTTTKAISGSAGEGRTPIRSPALKGRRSSIAMALTPAQGATYAKPRPVWSVFVGMLQKLATTQGLERASARSPTIDVLQKCVTALPILERAHFLRYLLKIANSKLSLHRLVACELIGTVLVQDWLPTHDEDTATVMSPLSVSPETPQANSEPLDQDLPLPTALWKALQGRLLDKLAAVRARATTSVEIVVGVYPHYIDEGLLSQLRRRALRDETATVRKAAVLALKQVLLNWPEKDSLHSPETLVGTLCELCEDSSLLTRKAAAESLTVLLEGFLDHESMGTTLEEAWSNCVLQMVLDEELGSKAITFLDRIVVTPLLSWWRNDQNGQADLDSSVGVAWRVLAHVACGSAHQGASKGSQHALQEGLNQLAIQDENTANNRIRKELLTCAAVVAKRNSNFHEGPDEQAIGVWCLLEALLSSTKHVKAMAQTLKNTHEVLPVVTGVAWKELLSRCQQAGGAPHLRWTLKSCLWVVSQLAPGLEGETSAHCQQNLKNEVNSFSFPPEVTGVAIAALAATSVGVGNKNARSVCAAWIRSTYATCEQELVSFAQSGEDASTPLANSASSERLIRALFSVGELSMVGFHSGDSDGEESRSDTKNEGDLNALRGMHEKPNKRLQELVQTLLLPTLPGMSNVAIPGNVRAHAFTVLGKLCLRDEDLAKQSLNIFAREIHPSSGSTLNPAVQSNALLVLGDLCVRYTNMADRYLPVMAACLQAGTTDPETNILSTDNMGAAVVRKHTVLLLSSLLLQDYIKWRGLLFHRFLVACSDEDEEVATLAENVLSGPLHARNPKLFFNHFVEAIFVFNKCTAHPIYVAAASQGDGGSGISVGFDGIFLSGEVGKIRRRRMYEFLLSKLSDEEKIGVTARLAKEVLGSAVESGEGELSKVCEGAANVEAIPRLNNAWNVMTDTFFVLTKTLSKVGRTQEDDDVEDPNVPNPSRQITVAKNRLLSKISRKHLIEIVLPILCQLKVKLQTSCSPLLKNLMIYLLQIYKTYKLEVKEYLANDPTLLQEIEYDSRQYSNQSSE